MPVMSPPPATHDVPLDLWLAKLRDFVNSQSASAFWEAFSGDLRPEAPGTDLIPNQNGSLGSAVQPWDAVRANQAVIDGIDLAATDLAASGATLIGYQDGETVYEMLNETINYGPLHQVAITVVSGLSISWSAGEVFTPGHRIVVTTADSGTCTDNAINYLKWTTGTGLTLNTTAPTNAEVLIGTLYCQAGAVWYHDTRAILSTRGITSLDALRKILGGVVTEGLVVSEDTDATNSLDVQLSAGTLFHDGYDQHVIASAIKSRTTAMVRWFHTSSVWANDSNAQIDTTNYDPGTNKTAAGTTKYYKSLFLVIPDGVTTTIHWIYPQVQYNTLAEAIAAPLPIVPPGLSHAILSTALVYKGGATALPTAGGTSWIDVRPMFNKAGAGTVEDHGSLAGLADDDHPQYLLVDGTRAMTDKLDMGTHAIDNVVDPATAQQAATKNYVDTTSMRLLQRVRTTDGAVRTSTTAVPFDNTTPANNEGAAWSALDTAITPQHSDSVLVVTVKAQISIDLADKVATLALYRDSGAAVAVAYHYATGTGGVLGTCMIRYIVAAGSTSATTFKLRFGANDTTSTWTNSATNGGAIFNSLSNSWIEVEEWY